MKKILSKIIISLLFVGVLVAPISFDFNSKKIIEHLEVDAQVVPGTNWLFDLAVDKTYKDLSKPWGCSILPVTWDNCIAKWVFYLIFTPLASLARLSAHILDFFIFYSVQDTSYRNNFITESWAIVRDLVNILFIVTLVYVAFKLVLGMDTNDAKKKIVYVILVALLINFSLFGTRVVIDASNILAQIFYNSIEAKNEKTGAELNQDKDQARSVTVGLVKQFNPQKMFAVKGEVEQDPGVYYVQNEGKFWLAMILAILVMWYMFKMFLSVALLFVSRVVSLWMAMIFSPVAFITQVLPLSIGEFSFSKWWDNLSKNAFLAPIFIFFLYIIVLFADTLNLGLEQNKNYGAGVDETFAKSMEVIIPFIVLLILLEQAKRIAHESAGELGKTLNEYGKKALNMGAMATGAVVLGGGALALRKTMGAMAMAQRDGGSNIAQSGFGRWAQNTPVVRGLRQFSTLNWVRRPSIGKNPSRQIKELEAKRDAETDEEKKKEINKNIENLKQENKELGPWDRTFYNESKRRAEEKRKTEGRNAPGGIPESSIRMSEIIGTSTDVSGVEKKTEGIISKRDKIYKDAGIEFIAKKEKSEKLINPEVSSEKTNENLTNQIQISDEENLRQERNKESLEQEKKEKERLNNIGLIDEKEDNKRRLETPQQSTFGSTIRTGMGAGTVVNIPSGATINVVGGAMIKGEGGLGTPIKSTSTSTEDKTGVSEAGGKNINQSAEQRKTDLDLAKEYAEKIRKGELRPTLSSVFSDTPSARTLKDRSAEGGWWPVAQLNIMDKLAKNSFDLRNTKLFKKFSENVGLDFGQAGGAGGYEKMLKDKKKRKDEFAKMIMPSGAETAALQSLEEDVNSIENEHLEIVDQMGLKTQEEKDVVLKALRDSDQDYQAIRGELNVELERINKIRRTRFGNYSDSVARGGGNIYDGVMSSIGIYAPVNIEMAAEMRRRSKKYMGIQSIGELTRVQAEEQATVTAESIVEALTEKGFVGKSEK